jgi:hypothetical protein
MTTEQDGLSVRASIIQDDGRYVVWFQLEDEDHIHPHDSCGSLVAGVFDTFDAATAALVGVRGLTIVAIDTHWGPNGRRQEMTQRVHDVASLTATPSALRAAKEGR